MKRAGLLIATALVVLVSPFVSAAEPLDDARVEVIRQNCETAQVSMQRVLRSDAATRINRGRVYEETTKLMAAFNSRAAINRYNVPQLVQATADFDKNFLEFKLSYITYDIGMKEALRIKCRDQPVTFYDALTKVREERVRLSQHVNGLSAALAAYDEGLEVVRAEIAERNGDQP